MMILSVMSVFRDNLSFVRSKLRVRGKILKKQCIIVLSATIIKCTIVLLMKILYWLLLISCCEFEFPSGEVYSIKHDKVC